MQGPDSTELTRLLKAWRGGDAAALDKLTAVVYDKLRQIAERSMMAERADHVLQPSALVNEAFIRLMQGSPGEWKDRAHFFGVTARLMRQILVDFARAQTAAKRGRRPLQITLSEAGRLASDPDFVDLVDIDAALTELETLHPRQAGVVELRFFGGLENREISEVLSVSEDTVLRDWRTARAWLYARLR